MSSMHSLRRAALVLCAFVLSLSPAIAGGVRIVDASGQKNFRDIQSAIDAAVDGDVLLVGAGTYPAFTIDGKGISIFAAPAGALVRVIGTVRVTNVHTHSAAVVGMRAEPDPIHPDTVRLNVAQCSAIIAFQQCTFLPGYPNGEGLFGADCASIQSCAAVVFVRCGFTGGAGAYLGSAPIPGGDGAHLVSSTVAMYGCASQGGRGGKSNVIAGRGGAGLSAASSWLFASGSSFAGGAGGDGIPPNDDALECGDGGDGLDLDSASEGHLLDDHCVGGPSGGPNCVSPGLPGMPIVDQGLLDVLPGAARSFIAPSVSVDRTGWILSVAGSPGDQVFLNRSLVPVFQYEPTLSGVCTALVPPFAEVTPLGVVPASGSIDVMVRQRSLPDGVLARINYLQGFVKDASAATVLGSPMHVLSLNWNSLPDCNGNGIQDYAEVIFGITPDADHDLVPDGCP